MKVCIVSDSHDRHALLEAAVYEAQAAGAESVLHCGDVVNPGTVGGIMAPATWVLGDLDSMSFSIYEVPGSVERRRVTA